MRKFKQAPGRLRAEARGELVRNARNRLRIGRFDVAIHLAESADAIQHFDRCLAQFEDFCVVTESVRTGIPVGVRVIDAQGIEVFAGGASAPAVPAGEGSAQWLPRNRKTPRKSTARISTSPIAC